MIRRRTIVIIVLSVLFCFVIKAQETDKTIDDIRKEFADFREAVNDEYEAFSKQVWKEYKTFKTEKVFKKPKPKVIPQAEEDKKPRKPEELFDKPIKPEIPEYNIPEDDFSNRRDDNFEKKLKEIAGKKQTHRTINFYGAEFVFHYNNFDFNLCDSPDEKNINTAVKTLFLYEKDIDDAIYQWSNYAYIMNLNDYGLLQLINHTGKTIFNDNNKSTLFTWFILNKLGVDMRIGIINKELIFISTSTVPLTNTRRLNIDQKTYYVLILDDGQYNRIIKGSQYVKTFSENLFKGEHKLNFLFNISPKILTNKKKNQFNLNNRFVREKGKNKIIIDYNFACIDFLRDMPTLDYPAYFHIPMSYEASQGIKKALSPFLENKNEEEKVNFLLNFVQYSFPYKFDKDNFGRLERPQAPEELLHYKYSDCEDHSALFAWLVNTFTDLEVIGILYSDHACTAVKFNSKVNGYHLPKPYQDYVICDATYIGASLGMCMPQYIGINPERVFKVQRKIY